MKTIPESFKLIIEKLGELDYYLLKVLGKPADNLAIRLAEKELGFNFNEELIQLYLCANGTDNIYKTPSGLLGLIPIHIFMSLKDSIEYYKNHIDFDDSFRNWNTNFKPDKKMFPFLEDGCGNCYWVDLNTESNNYGKIFWTNTFGDEPDYLYDSLTCMLHVISESYNKGIFFLDSDGYLDCDFDKFESISKDNNSGLNYWKNK
jgi:cell wall assembly regulator SMI1